MPPNNSDHEEDFVTLDLPLFPFNDFSLSLYFSFYDPLSMHISVCTDIRGIYCFKELVDVLFHYIHSELML